MKEYFIFVYSDKISDMKSQYENVIYSQLEKESEEMYEKRKNSFKSLLLVLSLYVFIFSILDLTYSYLSIENCQKNVNQVLSLTLNMWFRINGFYGLLYYFTLVLISYHLFTQRTFYRVVAFPNNENRYFTYLSFCILFTFIMLLWFVLGFYLFLSDFNNVCQTQAITVYLWIRLISGCVITISLFYFLSHYLELVL